MSIMSSIDNFVADIAENIRRYCQGILDKRGIDRLVKTSTQLAIKRLWGRLKAAAWTQGTSVEQQAISIVSGLFQGGSHAHLKKALDEYLDSPDKKLFLKFQAVVIRYASQELFHRWGENDPLGAKLWRNLQRTLRTDKRFVVFPNDRPEWVALEGEGDLREDVQNITNVELANIINDAGGGHGNLAEMVNGALVAIGHEPRYRKALKIGLLFHVIRENWSELIKREITPSIKSQVMDPVLNIAVERGKAVAIGYTDKRLKRLLEMNRLSPEYAHCFHEALSDLIDDLADGGPAQSYYRYISARCPGLSMTDYRQNHRTRFEYLAEIAQASFANEMKKQFVE